MAEYKLSYTANEIDEKLKRIKDGGVGYTEDGKVYTFNGDTTGLETGYHNGLQFVVLADEFFDPNTIEHITVSVSGTMVELSKDQFWIEEHSDAIATGYVVLTEYQGSTVPIALIQKSNDGGQEKSGVLADPNYNAFVARLKFADTIHKIDPKYLPTSLGNVLQVLLTGIGSEVYTASVSFDEAVEFILGGKYLDINYVNMYRDGTGGFGGRMDYYAYSPDNYDKPTITMERYSNMPLYWTPDGISNQQPSGGK